MRQESLFYTHYIKAEIVDFLFLFDILKSCSTVHRQIDIDNIFINPESYWVIFIEFSIYI